MKVKICAIDSMEALHVAINEGADAVGFIAGVTHVAEDAIDDRLEEAIQWIRSAPPFLSTVAVTHLTDVNEIVGMVRKLGVNTVQIHDYITPGEVKEVADELRGVKIIKAVHVNGREAIDIARSFEEHAHAILLDTRTTERLGGTGLTHDWSISREIVQKVKKPVILAGGLNPDNVYEAVMTVRPYGVDVNSGVEINGIKDAGKVAAFIRRAKEAAEGYAVYCIR